MSIYETIISFLLVFEQNKLNNLLHAFKEEGMHKILYFNLYSLITKIVLFIVLQREQSITLSSATK